MNKKNSFSACLLALLALLIFSCNTPGEKTVTIGDQVWMTENLDASTFRNGDTIPETEDHEEWIKAGQEGRPAWCYYLDDPVNGKKFGKLYNWYAVMDPRGLTPEGWHVPTQEEWLLVSKVLNENVSIKMRSKSGWLDIHSWEGNRNGTDESGFSGLPGGHRKINGYFEDIGLSGEWWSSTGVDEEQATRLYLTGYSDGLNSSNESKINGYYVRCLSGEETVQAGSVEPDVENPDIRSVKIGNQEWMAENLNVSTFRNGDSIFEIKTDADWGRAYEEGFPAWSYYDFDPENGKKYGKLYNLSAVFDPRGLAPEGWHIPSIGEWGQLYDFLGEGSGVKMKSTTDWNENGNGLNNSGFSAMPGGYIWKDAFQSLGESGYWWSSSRRHYRDNCGYVSLKFDGDELNHDFDGVDGMNVRCLKNTGDVRKLNNIGYRFYKEGNYIAALENFQKCFEIDNIYPSAHYSYACSMAMLFKDDFCGWVYKLPDLFDHLNTAVLWPEYKQKMKTDKDLESVRHFCKFQLLVVEPTGDYRYEIMSNVNWMVPAEGMYKYPLATLEFSRDKTLKFIYYDFNELNEYNQPTSKLIRGTYECDNDEVTIYLESVFKGETVFKTRLNENCELPVTGMGFTFWDHDPSDCGK